MFITRYHGSQWQSRVSVEPVFQVYKPLEHIGVIACTHRQMVLVLFNNTDLHIMGMPLSQHDLWLRSGTMCTKAY